jgi:hypothetical protein
MLQREGRNLINIIKKPPGSSKEYGIRHDRALAGMSCPNGL